MSTNGRLSRQRLRLCFEQLWECWWCGRLVQIVECNDGKLPDDAATIDHLDSRLNPLRGKSRGRRRVMACHACNHERGAIEEACMPIEQLRQRARSGRNRRQ